MLNIQSHFLKHPNAAPCLMAFIACGLCFMSPDVLALGQEEQVKELAALTTEMSKISKNACFILGTASAAIGTLWAVGAQNLKVFAASTAITILAFKAPAFFTSTMLI